MDNLESLHDLFSGVLPILINSSKGAFYFNMFYFLAFLLATGWLIGEGHKRKFHLLTWVIILAFTNILFVIGTKVISYSPADWSWTLQNLELVPTSSKMVLGGIFLGTAAVAIMVKVFKLPLSTIDAFAYVLPISMAVQRIGCFIIGCCYGKPTGFLFGVSYGHGTLPHFHQYQQGMIEASSPYTLPIHPFQLYESLSGILVVILLWRFRHKLKSAGSLLGISLGLSITFRFCLEFFRDGHAHAMGGHLIWGLKLMQWLLLIAALIAICFIVYNEKRKLPRQSYNHVSPIYPMRILAVLMICVMITWSLRNWFVPIELLVLNLILFPVIILAAFHFLQASTYPQYKWLTLTILIIPAFLMSQTWKETESMDTTRQRSFDTFRTGFSTGKFFSRVNFTTPANYGCNAYTSEDFENNYWNMAAGYSRTIISEKSDLIYGADLVSGKYSETNLQSNRLNSYNLFAIHPYVQYHRKWFGAGVGFYMGQNYLTEPNIYVKDGTLLHTTADSYYFFPSLYGRVGPERILFLDGGLASTFPTPFPGMQYEIALGSGFNLPKGNRFRFGDSPYGRFIQAEVLPHRSFLFSGSYVWSSSRFLDIENNRQLLLGLHYRFNHK